VTRAIKNATAVKSTFFLIVIVVLLLLFSRKQFDLLNESKIGWVNGDEVRDELLLV
jgi:hypothetical protein